MAQKCPDGTAQKKHLHTKLEEFVVHMYETPRLFCTVAYWPDWARLMRLCVLL